MPCVVNFSEKKDELKLLENGLRDAAAFSGDEDWSISSHTALDLFENDFIKDETVDMSCFDITSNGALERLEKMRSKRQETMLVLIADASVSPVKYMRPSIMASSLLLKPLNQTVAELSFRELMNAYYNTKRLEQDTEGKFCVETKKGKRYFYFNQIFYFEAREKKIFLNTGSREISFYSSLDDLENSLPPYFCRSHRGFIVNTRKIVMIQSSKGLIYCENNVIVPLSRSYKDAVKLAMGGKADE